MKMFKMLLSVGLGLSLLVGSAMAADEATTSTQATKGEKKAGATAAIGERTAMITLVGEVTKVEGDVATVKAQSGAEKSFTLSKDARIRVIKAAGDKATGAIADVKVGTFVSARCVKDGEKLASKILTVAPSADLLPAHKAAAATAGAADGAKKKTKTAATAN
ncbi:TPA: hypothetical protein DDW35_08625 [Candidatus Sumerlaeota bacterium]|jgi:hypothetical protein|nr:hypothetical protein [Candidatus Sumerlaeota bacterium]